MQCQKVQDKSNHMIGFFKFEGATFLTGAMFNCLNKIIASLSSKLTQNKKTRDTFAQ